MYSTLHSCRVLQHGPRSPSPAPGLDSTVLISRQPSYILITADVLKNAKHPLTIVVHAQAGPGVAHCAIDRLHKLLWSYILQLQDSSAPSPISHFPRFRQSVPDSPRCCLSGCDQYPPYCAWGAAWAHAV